MSSRSRGVARVAAYFVAAVVIAFVGPAIGATARRGSRWARETARETSSPFLGLLLDVLGPGETHHHGDRADVLEDLFRSAMAGRARRD